MAASLFGAVSLLSTSWRIRQSAPRLLPASEATRTPFSLARLTPSTALKARLNSMMPMTRIIEQREDQRELDQRLAVFAASDPLRTRQGDRPV